MTIKGHPWRLRKRGWTANDAHAGQCDPGTRELLVHRTGNEEYDQGTLVHEFIHAVDYEYGLRLSERAVMALERNLIANGWRRA